MGFEGKTELCGVYVHKHRKIGHKEQRWVPQPPPGASQNDKTAEQCRNQNADEAGDAVHIPDGCEKLGVEIVGDTKVKIATEENNDGWENISDTVDEQGIQKEIAQRPRCTAEEKTAPHTGSDRAISQGRARQACR